MPKKAYRAFNYIYEGVSHKFAPGDDVPDEIVAEVEPSIFEPTGDEETFTHGNANTELLGEKPHAEKVRDDGEGVHDNLSKMNVPQLVKLATDRGLEVPDNPKKATLLELLRDDAAQ